MNDTFIYLLKSMIYSGILFGYYSLFLKNTIYHSYNRFYLLASMVFSLVFPIFHITIDVFEEEVAATPALKYLMYGSSASVHELRVNIPSELVPMYVISALLLCYLAYSVIRILRLKAVSAKMQMGEFTFIETDLDEAPFSFFSNLFWKKSISLEDESGRTILQHELTHIREKHSWDRIFSQFICSVFWMNPFNWIIQKELQNIHEFIADRDAVGSGEVDTFAKMLLKTHYGNYFLNPSHSFYYSSIKRRIIMLTTSQVPKYAYLRKVAVLPLVMISLILFSIQLSGQKTKPKKVTEAKYLMTIRPDSFSISDPKTGKKVLLVATEDMSPPPAMSIPAVTQEVKPTKHKISEENINIPKASDVIFTAVSEYSVLTGNYDLVTVGKENVGDTEDKKIRVDFKKDKPLIVIDGVISSEVNLKGFNPNNIQSINILKGDNATTKYAEKGANGVVEITTKKN